MGHWAKANPRVAATAALRAKVARRKQMALEFAERGGLVEMQEKSARWDDEWAVAGAEALRDTEQVLDILGRYGRVEVSYTPPREPEDPLLTLDSYVEILMEKRHADRLRKEFEKAGFTGLTDDEIKYLWINYDSVEEFAA